MNVAQNAYSNTCSDFNEQQQRANKEKKTKDSDNVVVMLKLN